MEICSPLWGRSHTGGCSKDPSRPKGGSCNSSFFIDALRRFFSRSAIDASIMALA
ncbi:MAG: hypothetical protein IKX61_03015 [Prevotella sp.]|nr:hypothetical protein [Prevotella sp.]